MLFIMLSVTGATTELPDKRLEFNVSIEGIGELILQESTDAQADSSQLVLKKTGGMREVIDSFDGLMPSDLIKFDLDTDGSVEIIALLRHSDGIDVIPHIYSSSRDFKRLFPPPDQETNPLICREVFVTTYNNQPAVCTRHLIAFHESGPPELFRLEYYHLVNDRFEMLTHGYSEGDHFNILMNRGAYAFHSGQYIEALDFYNQAISSSTGDITTKAFIEALFYLAESRKYLKDFKSALELYQKIVLEFSQNPLTDQSQREIELISENLENPESLSFYVDVTSHVNCDRWETALELLQQHPVANSPGPLQDRFIFTKAEVLTALNRIEEAIEAYREIKSRFPDSSLIESIDAILEDMEARPEETDGL